MGKEARDQIQRLSAGGNAQSITTETKRMLTPGTSARTRNPWANLVTDIVGRSMRSQDTAPKKKAVRRRVCPSESRIPARAHRDRTKAIQKAQSFLNTENYLCVKTETYQTQHRTSNKGEKKKKKKERKKKERLCNRR
ncbi:unnamed protein product [Pipistrellus nathusii]|uniref:Uncharacterized protein n=1 Tax=Pipistrellus nathusii TaxID=59473 RepID=A0ABN9ZWS2_PIPNA